jgi:HEF_HK domain
MELKLALVADRNLEALISIKDDLRALHWTRDEEGRFIGMNLMNESLQEDLLAMRERSEADLELTQLGMALNVVNHEFEVSIRAVRSSLRRLKSWADINEDLQGLYDDLRTSFDHIDGYLSLFTPLQRRLYRTGAAQSMRFLGGYFVSHEDPLFSAFTDISHGVVDRGLLKSKRTCAGRSRSRNHVLTVAPTASLGSDLFVMEINTSVMGTRWRNGLSSKSQCFFSPKP